MIKTFGGFGSMMGLCGALALAACGGDGNSGNPNVTPDSGGTVTSDDGLVTLKVPPGAVDEPVEIAITRVAPSDVPDDLRSDPSLATTYELAPDGLEFAVPATLTAEMTPELIAGAALENGAIRVPLMTSRTSDAAIELLGGDEVTINTEETAITMVVPIEHFSWVTATSGPMSVALSPPSIDTEAPDNWIAELTAVTMPEADVGQTTLGWDLEDPSWAISKIVQEGIGVVLPTRDVDEVFFSIASEEEFVTREPFRCDEAGTGQYMVSLSFGFVQDALHRKKVYVKAPARCREPETTDPAPGPNATLTAPEAGEIVESYPGATGPALVLGGAAGVGVYDLMSGGEITQAPNMEVPGTETYRGTAVEDSSGTTWVLANGPSGIIVREADATTGALPAFGQLLFPGGSNVTDLVTLPEGNLLAVRNDVGVLTPIVFGVAGPERDDANAVSDPLLGGVVAAAGTALGSPWLAVTEGNPGKLVLVSDISSTATVTEIGDLGNGPRDIECAFGAAGKVLCLATSYLSNQVHPIEWTMGTGMVTIGTPLDVPGGPLGVDVTLDGDALLGSVGQFSNNSITYVHWNVDGTPALEMLPVANCAGPAWPSLRGTSKTIVPCNQDDTYVVVDTPQPQ